jgi:hypothetical protein
MIDPHVPQRFETAWHPIQNDVSWLGGLWVVKCRTTDDEFSSASDIGSARAGRTAGYAERTRSTAQVVQSLPRRCRSRARQAERVQSGRSSSIYSRPTSTLCHPCLTPNRAAAQKAIEVTMRNRAAGSGCADGKRGSLEALRDCADDHRWGQWARCSCSRLLPFAPA